MANEVDEATIYGEIKFEGDAPESPLPNPSILTVKLVDAMRMDIAATNISEVEIDAHPIYVKGEPLKYSMRVKNLKLCPEYSVSKLLILYLNI